MKHPQLCTLIEARIGSATCRTPSSKECSDQAILRLPLNQNLSEVMLQADAIRTASEQGRGASALGYLFLQAAKATSVRDWAMGRQTRRVHCSRHHLGHAVPPRCPAAVDPDARVRDVAGI